MVLRSSTLIVSDTLTAIIAEDIEVTMIYGPLVIGGVRRGYWPVSLCGVETRVYCEVSAEMEVDDQRRRVQRAAVDDRVFEISEGGQLRPSLSSLIRYVGYLESELQRRFGETGITLPRSVIIPNDEEKR